MAPFCNLSVVTDRRRLSRLCGGGSTCFGIGLLNRRAHNLQALADEVIE
jgi:hypothetical protein